LTSTTSGYAPHVTEPPAAPKRWFRRAARGSDETTPWLVLGGVHLAVAAFAAIVIAGVLVLWFALRY
jgi:hypothetical protein